MKKIKLFIVCLGAALGSTIFPQSIGLGSTWNPEMQKVLEPGTFKVMVGSSAEDIRLNGSFEIKD